MQDRRFPVGRFVPPGPLAAGERKRLIDSLAGFPSRLESALDTVSDELLDLRYREDGWTVRQVIHHVADSHVNGYLRCKWALTEDHPTIKPYEQDRWAGLQDVERTPVEVSLRILAAIHQRWTVLLRSLSEDEFRRHLHHPEEGDLTIETLLALYEWHGRHHLGHVRLAMMED